jgi:hypothetical protein
MQALVIGSRALACYLKPPRPPQDVDLIVDEEFLSHLESKHFLEDVRGREGVRYHMHLGKTRYEIELASLVPSSRYLLSLPTQKKVVTLPIGEIAVASLDALLTIKKSHLVLPIRWWKHITDYHLMKKSGKAEVLPELLELRRAESLARSRRPSGYNMQLTNKEFFNRDIVERHVPHDYLHQMLAYYNRPLYQSIKHNPDLAKCDRDLFEKLSPLDQVRCVREELYALTVERRVIPAVVAQKNWEPWVEYYLRKTLAAMGTTITAGWFREFIHENAPRIMQDQPHFIRKTRLLLAELAKS